jgi:hypothetical protein
MYGSGVRIDMGSIHARKRIPKGLKLEHTVFFVVAVGGLMPLAVV